LVKIVPLPKLGAGVFEEARVIKWLKTDGEYVGEGEPLVEIETEKANVTYESPTAGFLLRKMAAEGDVVLVGRPLCVLGDKDEQPPPFAEGVPTTSEEPAAPTRKASTTSTLVSPAAAKLAESMGVSLQEVVGTGEGGMIMREDVLKAARSGRAIGKATVLPKTTALSGMRAVIAARLSKIHSEAALVTLTRETEVSAVVDFIQGFGERLGISYNDVFIKATAEAIRQHEVMNSILENNEIKTFRDININVAVALEGGLVAPTIRNADRLPITEVSRRLKELKERAVHKRLTLDDLSGGTFTISGRG